MSVSKQSAFSTAQKQQKLFPCTICKKLTDQTCSLCRKVFYCSSQHQQIDWHMKHKSQCEGKIVQYNNRSQSSGLQNIGQFQAGESMIGRTFQQTPAVQIQQRSVQVRIQNESREWMRLFEERLIMRRKCLDGYQKLLQSTSINNNANKTIQIQKSSQLATTLQEALLSLTNFSMNLLNTFKPQFTPILQQSFGMTTSVFILQLDSLLDMVLFNKFYSLVHKHQKVRKFLLEMDQLLPVYSNDTDSRFRDVYESCLKAMLELSQRYCNDRVSQEIMSRYVLMMEYFQGVMQRVYAYMNFGLWYMRKTYYHKAIKCYQYSLQLLQSHMHKSNSPQSSLFIKSNLLFNLSLSQYELNLLQPAYQSMQESYRLRIKFLGKNAIESSHCLFALAQWTFHSSQWQDTLQYAKQCYRIRKLNKDNYPEHLQSIQKLLQQIYHQLKTQREKNLHEMNTQNMKYYDAIANNNHNLTTHEQRQRQEHTLQPQESFIKQLNSSIKPQLVQFRLIITPEMAETYSSKQWEKLTKLLEIDQLMHKEEMRRIIFESEFTESLNQSQRDAFIKANLIE